MNKWEKSAKICAEAREYGKKLCVEGASYLDIAEKVEKKIIQLGGKPAFPVDTSINSVAAHTSPFPNDKRVLQKGDLVKLDLGAHIDGHVSDTAVTVEVGTNKNIKLIKASAEALKAAIETTKPNISVCKIGAAIGEVITSAGFNPIKNLSGHGLDLWQVHTSPTIPNYDNGDETKLSEGQIVAIETFSTTGEGFVKDGKPSGVYGLVDLRPVRLNSVRRVLKYIQEEYRTLPFSARWLQKFQNINFALRILEKEGIVKQYPELPERSGGLVAQTEHTIEVGKGILTK